MLMLVVFNQIELDVLIKIPPFRDMIANLDAQHDWQTDSVSKSSDWLNKNIPQTYSFLLFMKPSAVTDTDHFCISDICQLAGTFSLCWSIKKSYTASLKKQSVWSLSLMSVKQPLNRLNVPFLAWKSCNMDQNWCWNVKDKYDKLVDTLRWFHFQFTMKVESISQERLKRDEMKVPVNCYDECSLIFYSGPRIIFLVYVDMRCGHYLLIFQK